MVKHGKPLGERSRASLAGITEEVYEERPEPRIEESGVYKTFEFTEPPNHVDNVGIERLKYPYDVYTLTLFLTSCRGLAYYSICWRSCGVSIGEKIEKYERLESEDSSNRAP